MSKKLHFGISFETDIRDVANQINQNDYIKEVWLYKIIKEENYANIDITEITHQRLLECIDLVLSRTKITHLDLSFNELNAASIEHIKDALNTNCHLKTLDLSYNKLRDEGAQAIANILKENSALENLMLKSNMIRGAGAKAIAQSLFVNKTLKRLDFCNEPTHPTEEEYYNHIGDEGTNFILKALSINQALMEFNAQNNKISFNIAASLNLENSALKILNLCDNNIDDIGLGNVLKSLKSCPRIQQLFFGNNKITSEGIKSLAEFLETNKSIVSIYLEGNQITDEGVSYLPKIEKDSHMRSIDLSNNSLSQNGVNCFLDYQILNNISGALSFDGMTLDDKAFLKLSQLIVSNNITSLNLWGACFLNTNYQPIFDSIKRNTSLTILYLDNTLLPGDQEMIELLRIINHKSNIRSLKLFNCFTNNQPITIDNILNLVKYNKALTTITLSTNISENFELYNSLGERFNFYTERNIYYLDQLIRFIQHTQNHPIRLFDNNYDKAISCELLRNQLYLSLPTPKSVVNFCKLLHQVSKSALSYRLSDSFNEPNSKQLISNLELFVQKNWLSISWYL